MDRGREIRIFSSWTHTMDSSSSSDYAGCCSWGACPCQLRLTTILPGAPDTAEPLYRPYRRYAGEGTGSGPGYVRVSCGFCDISVGCVHACFLFTLVNTQYEAGSIIYPDFATGFAALPRNSYLPERIVPQNVQDLYPGFCWKPRYNI